MALVNSHVDGTTVIHAVDVDQFFNLLTGVMTDQAVTLANALTLSGSFGIQLLAGQGLDTSAAGQLKIGPTNATSIVLGVLLTGTGGLKFADPTDTTKLIQLSLSGMTTAKTLTLASAQATTQTLTVPVIRQGETLAIKPQTTQASPANPTGTASTTGVMMGLAGALTPQVTGNVLVMISGTIFNATAIADGGKVQIRTGTGGAPTNGAALTGNTAGGLVQYIAATTAEKAPFAIQAIVTGLALGTAIWIDVGLAAITGGTATLTDLSLTAFEL